MLTNTEALAYMASENKDRGDALVHSIGHISAAYISFLVAMQMQRRGEPVRRFHITQAEINAELGISPNTQLSCINKLNARTTINKDDPAEQKLITITYGKAIPKTVYYEINIDKYVMLVSEGVSKKLELLSKLKRVTIEIDSESKNQDLEVSLDDVNGGSDDLAKSKDHDLVRHNNTGIHPSPSASSSLSETLMPSSQDSSQCPSVNTSGTGKVGEQEKRPDREGVRRMQERMKQEAQSKATEKRNVAMEQATKKQPAVQHLIDYAAERRMLMPGATGSASRVKPDTIKFIIDTLYAMVKRKPITMWKDAELTEQTVFTEDDFKRSIDNYHMAATSPDFHPISPKSKQFLLSIRLAEFLYYTIHNESKFLQFLTPPRRRVEDADCNMTKYLTDAFMKAKRLPADVPLNHKDVKNLTEAANKLAKYREDNANNISSVDAVGPMLARMAVEVVADYFDRKGEDWELQDLKAPWITNGALTRKLKEKGAWKEKAAYQPSFQPDEEMRAAREGHYGA